MAACAVCQVHVLSMQTVGNSSGRCQGGRRAWQPAVSASWITSASTVTSITGEVAIQRSGVGSDSPSPSSSRHLSSAFGRLSSSSLLLNGSGGLHYAATGNSSWTRGACNSSRRVVCETAVKIGDTQSSGTEHGGIEAGSKVKVKKPITVYHVSKAKNLNIEGLVGEVTEVLGVFKGRPISATFPIKTQFVIEADGKEVKFFAHLKPEECEIVE